MSLIQWPIQAPPYARFSLAQDGSIVLLFSAGYERAVLSQLRATIDALEATHVGPPQHPQQPPAQFAGQHRPAQLPQAPAPQGGQAMMPPTYAPPAAHTQNAGFSPYGIQPPSAGGAGGQAAVPIRPPPPPHNAAIPPHFAQAAPQPQGGWQAPVLPQPPVHQPPPAPDTAIRPVPQPTYAPGHAPQPHAQQGHGGAANPYTSAKARMPQPVRPRVPMHQGPTPRNGIAITPQGAKVIGQVAILPQPEVQAPPPPPVDPNAPPVLVRQDPSVPAAAWQGHPGDQVPDAEFEAVPGNETTGSTGG